MTSKRVRLRRRASFRHWVPLAIIVSCGFIGAALLVVSHASTPAIGLEAESGSIVSPAASGTDSTASQGHYVKFAAASGGTGTAVTRQNWPCSGCITYIPAAYQPSKPSTLLVALHGDEGTPTTIESYWQPTAGSYNVILFTPHCPISLGCNFDNGDGTTSSWWAWLQNGGSYSDSWLGQQVDTIAKSYSLDTAHEYLTGWSGGADYLGDYALLHGNRFAAVAYVVGGVPYVQSCPAGKMAAYFLMGSADFRYTSGQPSQVKGVFDGCGDTTKLVVLAGEDHQGTINALVTQGYANTIMAWLLTHKLGG